MCSEWTVPTEWLHESWFKMQKMDIKPQLAISDGELRVITFPKGGAGMRICRHVIAKTPAIAFEVSDALRCFVKKCLPFPFIRLCVQNGELSLSVESPIVGVQYKFPKLVTVEENEIPPHKDDQHIRMAAKDWFDLWPTIPPKGEVTLTISKQTKIMTLKHSGGRWGAAITMKNKPKKDQSVTVASGVAKSVFIGDVPQVWGTIVFMHVGVLQWFTPDMTVYMAPIE